MAEVALFGGSFDPPHLGHAYVITSVLAREPVDELWLLPTPAHAFGKQLADFELRFRMCEALAKIFGSRVSVSRIEAELVGAGGERGPSRTVDTAQALRSRFPETDFAWVIGSDLLREVPTWKDPERLKSLVRFIVVDRAGRDARSEVPIPDVSSTELRSKLAAGEPIDHLVPAEVARLAQAAAHYTGA